jgi:hypothetical protein
MELGLGDPNTSLALETEKRERERAALRRLRPTLCRLVRCCSKPLPSTLTSVRCGIWRTSSPCSTPWPRSLSSVSWKREVKYLIASGRRGLDEAEGDEVGEADEETEALGLGMEVDLGGSVQKFNGVEKIGGGRI